MTNEISTQAKNNWTDTQKNIKKGKILFRLTLGVEAGFDKIINIIHDVSLVITELVTL